jgi:hypothetical protein
MPEVIAKKPLVYANKRYLIGEKFEATKRDAKILTAIKKVEIASEISKPSETLVSKSVTDSPTFKAEKPKTLKDKKAVKEDKKAVKEDKKETLEAEKTEKTDLIEEVNSEKLDFEDEKKPKTLTPGALRYQRRDLVAED